MSKLKRQRKKQVVPLDDSDDFVPNKSSKSRSQPAECRDDVTEAGSNVDVRKARTQSPPNHPQAAASPSSSEVTSTLCPLCRKRVTDETSHLKACGARLGLTTQQMLEVRRMEERHREDRKRLGLPDLLPDRGARQTQKSGAGARKKAENRTGAGAGAGGADPDLELALALSISATAEDCVQDGPSEEVQPRPAAEAGDSLSALWARVEEPVRRQTSKMWLPQVSAPGAGAKKRNKGKLKRLVTELQTRTEEERQRLLGERVAKVLEEETFCSPRPSVGQAQVAVLWSLAGRLDSVNVSQLQVDSLRHLFLSDKVTAETDNEAAHILGAGQSEEKVAAPAPETSLLGQQWLQLLHSGELSDVTVQCRDDAAAACHSLVLHVRCPRALARAVQEDSRRYILILDQYSRETVMAALEYAYSGVMRKPPDKSVSKLLKEWGLQYNINSIQEIIESDASEEAARTVKNVSSTQYLDALIECLEETDKDSQDIEEGEEEENNSEDIETSTEDDQKIGEEEEWDELCEYMTQRKRSEITLNKSNMERELELHEDESHESGEDLASEKRQQDITNAQTSQTMSTINSRSSSPDMFNMSESDNDDIKGDSNEDVHLASCSNTFNATGGLKRKPSSESSVEASTSKRVCMDDVDQDVEGVIDLTQGDTPTPPKETTFINGYSGASMDGGGDLIEIRDSPELRESPVGVEEILEDVFEDESKDEENLVSKLNRLTSKLVDSTLSEDELVSVLVELAQLEVTVPALLETGAGKVVRRMKGAEGKVGRLAARLVIRWKRVVLAYNPDADKVEAEQKPPASVDVKSTVNEEVISKSEDLMNRTGLGHDDIDTGNYLPDIPPQGDQEEIPEVDPYLPVSPRSFPEADFPDDPECQYTDHAPLDVFDPVHYSGENDENVPPSAASPRTPVSAFSARHRYRTPTPGTRPGPGTPAAVTPLPDYSAMLTPQLRAELNKFGLKAVPRRKACLLLNHIYDQTHPLVAATPRPQQEVEEDAADVCEDGSQLSYSQHMPEESVLYGRDEDTEPEEEEVLTQRSGASLHQQLHQFVVRRVSLHQAVLLYEPLWLGQLLRDVKEAGIKCNLAQLQVRCFCLL